jgi:hypothetical protein
MACLWPKFNQASGEEHGVRLLPAAEGDLAGKESERGFAQALDRLLPTQPRLGRAVIVPSASALEGTALSSLVREAQLGATVLIDLADGFASQADIARTRINLAHHLGIEIADPVTYGTGDYIIYRWPLPVLVRHFTRISYVKPGRNTPVAHLGIHSIAVRKEIGLGSVVIIGSTLGSLLLAGDEQAYQILARLLATNEAS